MLHKRRWLPGMMLVSTFSLVAFAAGIKIGDDRGIPFVGWEEGWFVGVYTGPTPFDLHPAKNVKQPVLRGQDVTDYHATFVADPFMVHKGDLWYMFVEVMNAEEGQGDIGLATSSDGFNWTWDSIVLDEPFHLSYPQVFEHDDEWYMIPESHKAGAVKLYKATSFPTKWVDVANLIDGPYYDSTLLQWGDHWYMITGEKFAVSRLWIADSLFGPWTEHPASPLHVNDEHHYRCGGRMIVHDGKPYRFNQDVKDRYGNRVRAFEITKLSPTEYEEQQVGDKALLIGTGADVGWNKELMHHIDAHQLPDGTWIAVVDGFGALPTFGLRY